MERGIYFDAWYKHNHCYHPSLPLRNIQMLEDLKKYHGTVLVWAGMGGGSISLPYLKEEAFGEIDPRLRFYGFMNDSEFAEECGKAGISLFGIVFEVQGWEFPAVIDQNGRIARLNLHAEAGEHDWYGLREFSQDKYPDAFPTKLSDYYPDGIVNSAGEKVTDLWEECTTRDLYGRPVHAEWVEVKNHAQQAYQMCRNNPVWRDYLKKIMEIQIDAGVQGIQLDECELPMTAITSGGCFCRDCMREFAEYLTKRRAEGKLSSEWDGIDVEHFHYGDYLKEHGCTYPEGAPFFEEYWKYQVTQVRKYFSELADHARSYAMEKYGRKIRVSGNFYNLQPAYHPIVPKADIIITEMEHTLFRQPYFYRYSAGFAEGKPVIVAENPYGGIIPELLRLLDQGRGYDLYRIYLLEASVYGCNMSVPYGAWMGNTIKDAFWPPRSVTAQVQDFLYEHEEFFPGTFAKGAAVLYSYGSNYWRDAHRAGSANGDAEKANMEHVAATTTDWGNTAVSMPFWDVIRLMSSENTLYDVKMLPDGDLREDDFCGETLDPYDMLVVPDCWVLTPGQADILLEYARSGRGVLVYGRLAEDTDLAEKIGKYENVRFVSLEEGISGFRKAFDEMYAEIRCVDLSVSEAADRSSHEEQTAGNAPEIGMQRYDAGGKTYVHLLNYAYDDASDAIIPVENVEVRLNALGTAKEQNMEKEVLNDTDAAQGSAGRKPAPSVRVFHLDGESGNFTVRKDGDSLTVCLEKLPVYTVIAVE